MRKKGRQGRVIFKIRKKERINIGQRIEQEHIWRDLHPKVKRGFLALKENATIEDGKVFNEHGTDVSHLAELTIKTTTEQARGLKAIDELSEHEIENGGFVFAFYMQSRTIAERFPSLNQQDIARLMFIGTYVAWQTSRLQYDNGRIIDKKGLEQLIGLSTKRFNEFYKRLEAEDIIKANEEKQLFINPSVFYRGKMKEIEYDVSHLQYTRMFRKTVRELYEHFKGKRTLGQLTLIYSVLPFLNLETNIICFNPQEQDEELLKPMNVSNLATLLEYNDKHKLKRALDSVMIDGKRVFWCPHNINDKREYRIIVNPNIIYGGNGGESLKNMKVLFR